LEAWSGRRRGRAPFSQASTSTHGASGAGKRFLQSGRRSAGLGSRRGCSCSARLERSRAASTSVACRSSRRRRARRQRGQPMERKSAAPTPSDCCATRAPVTLALATSCTFGHVLQPPPPSLAARCERSLTAATAVAGAPQAGAVVGADPCVPAAAQGLLPGPRGALCCPVRLWGRCRPAASAGARASRISRGRIARSPGDAGPCSVRGAPLSSELRVLVNVCW
jgi:hypothetical protein